MLFTDGEKKMFKSLDDFGGKPKENKLFEDELVYIFKDISPKAEHHFLVIPKYHIRDTSQINSFNQKMLVSHMIE